MRRPLTDATNFGGKNELLAKKRRANFFRGWQVLSTKLDTTCTGVTFGQTATTTGGLYTIALVVGSVVQPLNTVFVRRSFTVLRSTQLP